MIILDPKQIEIKYLTSRLIKTERLLDFSYDIFKVLISSEETISLPEGAMDVMKDWIKSVDDLRLNKRSYENTVGDQNED